MDVKNKIFIHPEYNERFVRTSAWEMKSLQSTPFLLFLEKNSNHFPDSLKLMSPESPQFSFIAKISILPENIKYSEQENISREASKRWKKRWTKVRNPLARWSDRMRGNTCNYVDIWEHKKRAISVFTSWDAEQYLPLFLSLHCFLLSLAIFITI